MLSDFSMGPAIAVKDLDAAKKFYNETLGLEVAEEYPGGGGIQFKSGQTTFMVYPSQYAGSNKATYAGWGVDDASALVTELEAKGVTFVDYPDMEGITIENHVHSWNGEGKTAWFTDPDGNILALNQL